MTVKERITEFINSKEISIRAFCRKAGLSETYVTSMRNSIQPDKLTKITTAFPELNVSWLLTGEGQMLKQPEILPPIEKDKLVELSADVFKDKLIEMFKSGEIFSASIVWEQHRIIIDQAKKVEELQKDVERFKCLLAQNGITVQ